MTFANFQLR